MVDSRSIWEEWWMEVGFGHGPSLAGLLFCGLVGLAYPPFLLFLLVWECCGPLGSGKAQFYFVALNKCSYLV
ncbi:hypothetical protein RchiOBHm_Chr5g0005221 [Rosa chinensis]|uniref:Uncharacterized protein n=1 Tax=Rosa chinensis TaxID=74649 RepID=A0A2P6Q379_ROSCH|nr:hypothetical protein RchiOBHm_Chr5g0005221 [Rosa chinensis]